MSKWVISPAGQLGTIPDEQLESAIAAGYRVADAATVAKHGERQQYEQNKLKGFGYGALMGIPGGSYFLDEAAKEEAKKFEEYVPGATQLGNVLGFGATSLGIGVAGRLAGGALGVAEATGFGSSLARHLGAEAVEGAAIGVVDETNRANLYNRDVTAEGLASAIIQNAGAGLALGAVPALVGASGKLASRAEAAADRAVGGGVNPVLGKARDAFALGAEKVTGRERTGRLIKGAADDPMLDPLRLEGRENWRLGRNAPGARDDFLRPLTEDLNDLTRSQREMDTAFGKERFIESVPEMGDINASNYASLDRLRNDILSLSERAKNKDFQAQMFDETGAGRSAVSYLESRMMDVWKRVPEYQKAGDARGLFGDLYRLQQEIGELRAKLPDSRMSGNLRGEFNNLYRRFSDELGSVEHWGDGAKVHRQFTSAMGLHVNPSKNFGKEFLKDVVEGAWDSTHGVPDPAKIATYVRHGMTQAGSTSDAAMREYLTTGIKKYTQVRNIVAPRHRAEIDAWIAKAEALLGDADKAKGMSAHDLINTKRQSLATLKRFNDAELLTEQMRKDQVGLWEMQQKLGITGMQAGMVAGGHGIGTVAITALRAMASPSHTLDAVASLTASADRNAKAAARASESAAKAMGKRAYEASKVGIKTGYDVFTVAAKARTNLGLSAMNSFRNMKLDRYGIEKARWELATGSADLDRELNAALAPVAEVDPELAAAAAAKAMAQHQALAQTLGDGPINKWQEMEAKRAQLIMMDPTIIMGKLSDGTLSYGDLLTARKLIPDTVKSMEYVMTQELLKAQSEGKRLKHRDRMTLSILMGDTSIDGMMDPVLSKEYRQQRQQRAMMQQQRAQSAPELSKAHWFESGSMGTERGEGR